MAHSINDFDYILPPGRIAQHPASPRESARLMLLNRKTGAIEHSSVKDLILHIHPTDIIVVNNTKVFHARLHGNIEAISVELFLVKPLSETTWLALGKPGKKISIGSHIKIADDFIADVVGKNMDGTLIVKFQDFPSQVIAKANIYGEVPVPPYIKSMPNDDEYQTVYAKRIGSVAAPTAGFHLTEAVLSSLKEKGVTLVEITLHVGLGTFLPVKSETIEEHSMHSEWAEVSESAAQIINQAKKEHRRVIAIGTTTVRTLEGVAALQRGKLVPFQGDISIFITPGFTFQVVDGMLTNFHLPKSTLIILVSAFAGRGHVIHAYNEAVSKQYRFYSFGDAMFIS